MWKYLLHGAMIRKEAEAIRRALPPLEELKDLLVVSTRPPIPYKSNALVIGLYYRKLDKIIAGWLFILEIGLAILFLILSPWPTFLLSFSFAAATLTLTSLYVQSKMINRLWGQYYLPLAQRRFEEHAKKICAVVGDIHKDIQNMNSVAGLNQQEIVNQIAEDDPYLRLALKSLLD